MLPNYAFERTAGQGRRVPDISTARGRSTRRYVS